MFSLKIPSPALPLSDTGADGGGRASVTSGEGDGKGAIGVLQVAGLVLARNRKYRS